MRFDMTQRLTRLYLPRKEGIAPLKRSLSGYEIEMFVLDGEGHVTDADRLISLARAQGLPVKKECSKGMLEVICMPHRKLSHTSIQLLDSLIALDELAGMEGLHLYPFGTFPGMHTPQFRKGDRYTAQQKIIGKEKFANAGLCCGFHQHYTLPRGTFDKDTSFLRYSSTSKTKRSLLDSYNFLIAADPLMTAFLQSSPYVNGKMLAKDSRLLLYRGGERLRYKQGMYANNQLLGGLQPYKQTLNDLIGTIKSRHKKWLALLEKNGARITPGMRDDWLSYSWNPVKINSKGTIEYRGGDSNFMSAILGVSTLIKFCLRAIQQDFKAVIPMDIELKDAFTVENNMIFIPPHSVVRDKLQPQSAYYGLAHDDVHTYADAFFRFAEREVYPEYRRLLRPIRTMLERRMTVADGIMRHLRYSSEIPEHAGRRIALQYSRRFSKDLQQTREVLGQITAL